MLMFYYGCCYAAAVALLRLLMLLLDFFADASMSLAFLLVTPDAATPLLLTAATPLFAFRYATCC